MHPNHSSAAWQSSTRIAGLGLILLALVALVTTWRGKDAKDHARTPPPPVVDESFRPLPRKAEPRSTDPTDKRPTLKISNAHIPLVDLPLVDLQKALEEARALEQKRGDGVYRFAKPIDVALTPENSGLWETLPDGSAVWRLRLASPGAESLNLGFTEYRMPDEGRLSIFPSGQFEDRPIRDFTESDNESHGQLWTPILHTDELTLEIVLPSDRRDDLALHLAKVNHGFRSLKAPAKIGGGTSGSCNIDVACINDPNVGTLIQAYADQIRSVGAYTLNGIDTCSGALVNNTANDAKPYFLTAEHCGISPGNAPSMVVYFNFENATCRTPGSSQSGGVGNGNLSQFSSGAIHRAESAASDFCLVELDDPIPPSYEVFFSGWDRSGANDIAVGIHHPAVAEKRISFELDQTVDDGSTHVRVSDWDFGTTEPGSSGSPLFDSNGRIIGDLTGGVAACGNDLYDSYGRFSVSWTGGGSASTRLSDWLDPAGTGAITIDGINQQDTLSIGDARIVEGDSGSQLLEFTVTLVRQGNDNVTVDFATFDDTAQAGSDYGSTTGTLNFGTTGVTRTIQVPVFGDTVPEENERFEVRLTNPVNASIGDAIGTGIIDNDDFIQPVIQSPLTTVGFVGSPLTYQITASNTPTSYSISAAPPGMTVNGTTGLVSWTPTTTGPATVTILASNSAGSGSATLTINVTAGVLSTVLDTPLGFDGGPLAWLPETVVTHDGVDAARSPDIGGNQTAHFETEMTTPAGGEAISFWWKVSSEEGFDYLRFFINGVLVSQISGEVDWTLETHELPAGSAVTLRWEYAKDSSISEGLDTGFIDEVSLASTDPLPTFVSPGVASRAASLAFSFQVEAIGATAYDATNLPPGLSIDPLSGWITGTPTTTGSTIATITASNANGSRQQLLEILLTQPLAPALDSEASEVTWSTQGDAIWFSQTATTRHDNDALQSGDIDDFGSSVLQAEVNFDGTQQVSFWWKVSSESKYDFLSFSVEGGTSFEISGEVNWEQRTTTLPAGPQTLTWEYFKDVSVSNGADAGWVDQVSFDYILDAPASLTASDGTVADVVTLAWSAVIGADSYSVFRNTSHDLSSANQLAVLPAGILTYDDTTALDGKTYHYWVRAFNATALFGAPDATDTGFQISPYLAWATAQGLTGSAAETTATPFGDGVENLLKFAFNMDGSGPDVHRMVRGTGVSGLPLIEAEGSGSERSFRFEYVRRIGSALTYTPEVSPTLGGDSWSAATAGPTITPIDSTWERVVIEEPIGAATPRKFFARVRVVAN